MPQEPLITKEEDILYEEDVLRNPYSLKSWVRYLEWKKEASKRERFILYERALKELPGSYKLWHSYLAERVNQVTPLPLDHAAWASVNRTFERALVFMHKMPRIWLNYTEFLKKQHLHTTIRRTYDRALRSLPLTQHKRIWEPYVKYIKALNIPELSIKVYRRYLRLDSEKIEEYIEYLLEAELHGEAAYQLSLLLNNDKFTPKPSTGKSKQDLWLTLFDIISKNPSKVKGLNFDTMIRGGLQKFPDEVGKLWSSLATYYIVSGHLDKARDIFEEGLNTVMTLKDFSQIWDAYVEFLDGLLAATIEKRKKEGKEGEEDVEVDMLVARYEYLIERRPLLVNSVLLRQNPHNVKEWHKRTKLFDDPDKIVETFTAALKTVDPAQSKGKLWTLWTAFARFYEVNGAVEEAEKIFETAVQAPLRHVDELASIWCEYSEMELRHRNYTKARELLQRATAVPRKIQRGTVRAEDWKTLPVQQRVHKSTRLWTFYADVEESLGTFMSTKAVYDKILELRIATPQLIINYAQLLEENKYFEESFKAYEKGVQLFNFPFVLDIWLIYLTKFVERYGGKKLERARDLFEQALEKAPATDAKILYLMYAKLEEEYGLARHAMAVYDRACKAVAEDERANMYNIYIARAAEFFGVTRTREIFEQGIESLPDKYVKQLCIKFSDLERKLGEVDRARAIYIHCSQYCDPQADAGFWKIWWEFELRHGNEDTFKEMLRIRRSVAAQFNSHATFVDAGLLQKKKEGEDVISQLMGKSAPGSEEVSLSSARQTAVGAENPDEIRLVDDESSSEEEEDEGAASKKKAVEQKEVPASVFGLPAEEDEDEEGRPLGALERFKRKFAKK